MPYALSIASVRHRVLRCGAQKFGHSDFFLRTRTAEARAYRRKKPHPLRRKKGGDALSDRARCCFASGKKSKQAVARPANDQALVRKEPADSIRGGRHSLPRDQIGVEATPTFALRQREAYLSFLRCSFSRLSYRGRALPSYMKVIGLGPRM